MTTLQATIDIPFERIVNCVIGFVENGYSLAEFTPAISDAGKAYDDMALSLQAYRQLYPGIRRAWLRSARPKMSKRAWRRLRGKVKGLKL